MTGHPHHESHQPRGGLSRGAWALIGFLAVAAYFLLSEHRAHFIQFLPFVLLAACPLMHLFHGHGGRGGHGRGERDETDGRKPGNRRPRSEGDSQ
jgi:hypothetical protein